MRLIRATDQPFVPASHEDPQRPGVLKRVILTKDEVLDGRVQMINWARLPAASSFRAHYHEDMEEAFMIVAGRCVMDVDGNRYDLGPGDTLVVAPHEIHAMYNPGSVQVEYIVVGVSLGRNGRTIVVQ
jgi:mannose-6-phosphate isomerase-like protein (cupin superfamily)